MLAISDLHVAYGQSEVLHGLNVAVAPNEIVAIMNWLTLRASAAAPCRMSRLVRTSEHGVVRQHTRAARRQ